MPKTWHIAPRESATGCAHLRSGFADSKSARLLPLGGEGGRANARSDEGSLRTFRPAHRRPDAGSKEPRKTRKTRTRSDDLASSARPFVLFRVFRGQNPTAQASPWPHGKSQTEARPLIRPLRGHLLPQAGEGDRETSRPPRDDRPRHAPGERTL